MNKAKLLALAASKSFLIPELQKESLSTADKDELWKLDNIVEYLRKRGSTKTIKVIDDQLCKLACGTGRSYSEVLENTYSLMRSIEIDESTRDIEKIKFSTQGLEKLSIAADKSRLAFERLNVHSAPKAPKQPFYKFKEGGKKRKNNFNRY